MNFTGVKTESWFLPIDVFLLVGLILAVLLGILFLAIIVIEKVCHTIPMLLVGNSAMASLIFGILVLSMRAYALKHDLYQLAYADELCSFRGYFGYAICTVQNFSFLLQAIYRYSMAVSPTSSFGRSVRWQYFLIILTWLFGFIHPIPILLSGGITYNMANQLCQAPLRLSVSILSTALLVYIIPVILTFTIYVQLIRYVRTLGHRSRSSNTWIRARRELKMVRRITILTFLIFTYCFPYAVFAFMSFYSNGAALPVYHFRIAYIFIETLYVGVVIALFQFTDPVKLILTRAVVRIRFATIQTISH
jgi:hypothetical protein